MRTSVCALLLAIAACKPATRPSYPVAGDDDHPGAGAPAEAAEPVVAEAPVCTTVEPEARRASGTIDRDELIGVLDQGPASFLSGVRVDADLAGGRFRGWRLREFWPCEPRYAAIDLQPGDVVQRVNGRSLERPEQVMQVWDGLREAERLLVELDRGGVPRKLEFVIADPE